MKKSIYYQPIKTIQMKIKNGLWDDMKRTDILEYINSVLGIDEKEFCRMEKIARQGKQGFDNSDITFWNYHTYFLSDLVRIRFGTFHYAVDYRIQVLEETETTAKIRYFDTAERKEKIKIVPIETLLHDSHYNY